LLQLLLLLRRLTGRASASLQRQIAEQRESDARDGEITRSESYANHGRQ